MITKRLDESGIGLLEALISLSILGLVMYSSADSWVFAAKSRRDTSSNSEINSTFDNVRKIVGTQWSCTASLAGSNMNGAIQVNDPVVGNPVVAAEGVGPNVYWKVSQARLQKITSVPGLVGVYSATLALGATKDMSRQLGAGLLTRTIPGLYVQAANDGTILSCYPGLDTVTTAQSACTALGGTWNSSSPSGSQCSFPNQNSPRAPANQPSPSPSVSPSPVCLSSTSSVIVLPNSNASISGNATINGDFDVLMGSHFSASGNAIVHGTAYYDSENDGDGDDDVESSKSGNAELDSEAHADLSSLSATVNSLAAYAIAAAPTAQVTGISGTSTLSGSGGQNVITVSGDLNLSGNDTLTLAGGNNDSFIVNVTGKITVTGNAAIQLQGVSPKQVLFNNVGTGNEIVLSGNGSVAGTFMATQRGAQVSGNGAFDGALIAGGGVKAKVTLSGNGLAMTPDAYCH